MNWLSSGNLKRSKGAHSASPLHLSGPLHQPPTCCFDTSQSRSDAAELRSACTFGGKWAQMPPPNPDAAKQESDSRARQPALFDDAEQLRVRVPRCRFTFENTATLISKVEQT